MWIVKALAALFLMPGTVVINMIGITVEEDGGICLLYTSPSPRDRQKSRMPSSA